MAKPRPWYGYASSCCCRAPPLSNSGTTAVLPTNSRLLRVLKRMSLCRSEKRKASASLALTKTRSSRSRLPSIVTLCIFTYRKPGPVERWCSRPRSKPTRVSARLQRARNASIPRQGTLMVPTAFDKVAERNRRRLALTRLRLATASSRRENCFSISATIRSLLIQRREWNTGACSKNALVRTMRPCACRRAARQTGDCDRA